jgi:hypothetical protein
MLLIGQVRPMHREHNRSVGVMGHMQSRGLCV